MKLSILGLALAGCMGTAQAATETLKIKFNSPVMYHGKPAKVGIISTAFGPGVTTCLNGATPGEVVCTTDDQGNFSNAFTVYAMVDNAGGMPLGIVTIVKPRNGVNMWVSNMEGAEVTLSGYYWTGGDLEISGNIVSQ